MIDNIFPLSLWSFSCNVMVWTAGIIADFWHANICFVVATSLATGLAYGSTFEGQHKQTKTTAVTSLCK